MKEIDRIQIVFLERKKNNSTSYTPLCQGYLATHEDGSSIARRNGEGRADEMPSMYWTSLEQAKKYGWQDERAAAGKL